MFVYLVDLNEAVAQAMREAFLGVPNVEAAHADILDYGGGDAIVSPANSFGWMDGGIDLAYARRWPGIEARVQARISGLCGRDGLPVGAALTVPLNALDVRWLIVAPTMRVPEPVPWSRNAFHAFRAALQQARLRGFEKVLCPGLGTLTGRIPAAEAARQMRAAWDEVTPGE